MQEKPKPQWIVFDIGGVLFDTPKALQTLATYAGVPVDELTDFFTQSTLEEGELGEIGFADAWLDYFKNLGIEMDAETFLSLYISPNNFVPGTLQLAQDLHTAGYKLATLTNSWKGIMQRDEQIEPLNVLFSSIIDSSEIGLRKPHPEIFTYTETLLSAKGPELFYIDDAPANVEEGEKFGWQTYKYDLSSDEGKTANEILRARLLG